MKAYDVYLRGKKIDTVFYTGYKNAAEVRRSLINHDSFHPLIVVLERPLAGRRADICKA
jgi:hypothetical protein